MFSISLATVSYFESTKVPWNAPGRNADCQFSLPLIGKPPGQRATNPGRFWFSVPSP